MSIVTKYHPNRVLPNKFLTEFELTLSQTSNILTERVCRRQFQI